MGLGGISIWQLLIVLAIVILLFGTKRLKGLGADLGNAIKGFKKAVDSDEKSGEANDPASDDSKDNAAIKTETHQSTSVEEEKK